MIMELDSCALTDCERFTIKPLLPNKPRGVSRVDVRLVLNGIFWGLAFRRTVARPVQKLGPIYYLL
jgi:transposase